MKRSFIAVVCIFIAWTILDILLHGVLLDATYQSTAHLWRPESEMKMGLMHVVRLLIAGGFVAIYARLIAPKSLQRGLWYGALWGFASGVSMGYGSYAYMPIPYALAFAWFAGAVVSSLVAGAIVGVVVKTNPR